jgi:hypothetical protein
MKKTSQTQMENWIDDDIVVDTFDDDSLSGDVSKKLDGITVIGAELVSEQRQRKCLFIGLTSNIPANITLQEIMEHASTVQNFELLTLLW